MSRAIDPRCLAPDGGIVMARGLSCPFCGASVTVWPDGTHEHHPDYECVSWEGDHEVRDFIVKLARRLMNGQHGWPNS